MTIIAGPGLVKHEVQWYDDRRRSGWQSPKRIPDEPWRIAYAPFSAARATRRLRTSGRLTRIERQLDSVEKIWQRTRHVEPAVQALLRERYLDSSSLPYPERLTARRFRISSQNQEDGLTLALLGEAASTCRRFVEIGSGLSGGNSGFLARECGWSGLMVDGHAEHMVQVGRRFPTVTAVAAWVTRDNINELITANGCARRSGSVQPRSGRMRLLDLGSDDRLLTARRHPRIQLDVRRRAIRDGAVRCEVRPSSLSHGVLRRVADGASRLSARKGYRLVAVEPSGVNAFFLRNDLAPHIPACEPARAFRLLEGTTC